MRRSTWSSGRSRTRRRSRRSRFGFADRSPGYRLPNAQTKDGVALRSRLRALGVLRASGHEHFRGCLTIPVLDGEGRVGEVYGRRVQKLDPRTATSAHLYLPGPHRGVFNAGVFASTDELIVTECLIDALTLWCAGFRHVTASYGADGSTTEHQAAVETHGIRWVLIAYDRDAAGADQLPAARQAAQAGPHRRRRDRARDHDHDGPGTGRRLRERPRLSPALIIDTGALVSIADTTDPHHDACATLLQNETEPLVTTAMVIAEAVYLLDRDLGPHAEALLYQMILDGDLHIDALAIEEWQRVHDLVVHYADLRLGGTDASLIALAEHHHEGRIATLNRRHFSVVRPTHVDAFTLLPDLP